MGFHVLLERRRHKGTIDEGYAKVQAIIDTDADKEPTAEMKRATKSYSHMAITCFVVTLLSIAALLLLQLFCEEHTQSVERIMVGGIIVMVGIAISYGVYRYIDAKRDENRL